MEKLISSEDRSYISDYLKSQRRGMRSLVLSANLLLVAGGLAIIVAALFLLQHRTDDAVLFVGVPNFLGGMTCFAAYLFLSKKTEEMRKVISIVSRILEIV